MSAPAAAPRAVVIDCDPGTDDALALWLAASSPELDVRLVTVVGGNAGLERTLPNARAVLGLAGSGVPVVAGAARPLLGQFRSEPRVHAADGLGGVKLPEGPPAAPGLASDAIRDLLRASAPGEITLVGLGPVTNLALALATEPALAGRVREIVLMSGAWGEGNWTPAAEFNAASDPEALAVLLGSGVPLTLVTLELTAQALVTPARLAALPDAPGGCLRAARAVMGSVPPSQRLGGGGFPLHDPCAVALLVRPGLFSLRPAELRVECGDGAGRGRTHLDLWSRSGRAANAAVAVSLDADGFFELLGERLGALP